MSSYSDAFCDDVWTTACKASKDMNGNMDLSQMIGKSSFQKIHHNKSVFTCGTSIYCNPLMFYGGQFPIEHGFCITIPKAQGWNSINYLLLSLSTPMLYLRFYYKSTHSCHVLQDTVIFDYCTNWEKEIHIDTNQTWRRPYIQEGVQLDQATDVDTGIQSWHQKLLAWLRSHDSFPISFSTNKWHMKLNIRTLVVIQSKSC